MNDILSIPSSAVTIGFERTSYTVNEADGTAVVSVAVLSGDLSRAVVVGFNTMDDSATSTGRQSKKTSKYLDFYIYLFLNFLK